MSKSNSGKYFEDFAVGQAFEHATPRSVSKGDQALYTALYGSRFALQSSGEFARSLGLPGAPLDDLLVFHIVFGKTVPDVSLNAVANLGYAHCVFGVPVHAGDTLNARSEVVGVKENSNGKTGTVYVRSTGTNQRGETVLSYTRWVMVRKRDPGAPAPRPVLPDLSDGADPGEFMIPVGFSAADFDPVASGSRHYWEDYEEGENIDHLDAMTIEEAEHQMATRLYQNTAKVHFNLHSAKHGRFGKRIVYGGHVISMARALSFNGLGNAIKLLAIHGGSHTAPAFGGDTIYAWSRIQERIAIPGRRDVGALRVRTIATKDQDCAGFPFKGSDGRYHPSVVLDIDYTALLPRRG